MMRLWALGYDFDDSIAYTEMHYVLRKYKIRMSSIIRFVAVFFHLWYSNLILAVMMMCGFCLQLTECQWFYIHSALSCIYNYLF